jgi:hypothetical protein
MLAERRHVGPGLKNPSGLVLSGPGSVPLVIFTGHTWQVRRTAAFAWIGRRFVRDVSPVTLDRRSAYVRPAAVGHDITNQNVVGTGVN